MSQYYMSDYFYVDVATPTTYTTVSNTAHPDFWPDKDAPSVIAEDLRAWLVLGREADTGTHRIGVIDIETRQRLGVVTCSTSPSGAWGDAAVGKYPRYGNVMYHNGALYFGAPYRMGGVIKKLVVPTTGTGSAKRPDVNGSWVWTTLTNNGTPPAAQPWAGLNKTTTVGTYSKLNIVKDMGNGQAALVLSDNLELPTYVYKLP
jgi:hypothetical protein